MSYIKDMDIYSQDAYYPASPVMLSDTQQMRGIDMVILGITPFQYNPVTKELVVFRDLRVRVDFQGAGGNFSEYNPRSRHWEHILKGNFLNYGSLPAPEYYNSHNNTDELLTEYIIIVPNDPAFIAWADTLKNWRSQQGIVTDVVTLAEIGGNTYNNIYYYLVTEYYTVWPPVLSAVLILSDYQSSGDLYGITSGYWNNYCVSDNMFSDVIPDNLPDLALGRICAQNNSHLSTMIGKMLDYERTPPTDPNYYIDPIMAGGWQTDRWFLLCTEIVYGYFANEQGKTPVRQYDLCYGSSSPGTQWSTTYPGAVVNYFGPAGTGYIPSTPSYLASMLTGSAYGINSVINGGTFLVQHRDHGMEQLWNEPYYTISNINQLTNDQPTFVFSTNCLTGKYNYGSNCFTEVFHRSQYGALGLNAASEVSYSFVNDTFVWGMYDSMWPDFDPGYGADSTGAATQRPCYANVSGKLYLQASSWPYNQGDKIVTYHLFHHHGDCFITLYSEVPENLTVSHQSVVTEADSFFNITADRGAIIALTVDNEIVGVGEAEGTPQDIPLLTGLQQGDSLLITITLQNYYRYMEYMEVLPQAAQYVIFNSVEINDENGNGNGMLDMGEDAYLSITMQNFGIENAEDVTVTLATEDMYITILDNEELYALIPASGTAVVADGFEISVSQDVPDMHEIEFSLTAENTYGTWVSEFTITAHAPIVEYADIDIIDAGGNNDQHFDPGETVDFQVYLDNNGSGDVFDLEVTISTTEPLITIGNEIAVIDTLLAGGQSIAEFFDITASPYIQNGTIAEFTLDIASENGYYTQQVFSLEIGSSQYLPSGPDAYGYYAFDMYDGLSAPVYEWTEIAPSAGGSGTLAAIPMNGVAQVTLPFSFQFYGASYTGITICEDGWIAMGSLTSGMPLNFAIPNTAPPNNLIAVLWGNFSQAGSTQICYYYDSANNRFIVEWYQIRLANVTNPTHRFQVILFNPAVYTTPTGDGIIQANYQLVEPQISYCTLGIENSSGTVGLQYRYNSNYIENASPLQSEFAIKYTTDGGYTPEPPTPFSLFTPMANDTCWALPVELTWYSSSDPNPGEIPTYDVWTDTLPDMSTMWQLADNIPDTTLSVSTLADDHMYYWTVYAEDAFTTGTWADDTLYFNTYFPEAPGAFALIAPSNGVTIAWGETLFDWEESIDPDPGDVVDYTLWFLAGEDSIGFNTMVDSMLVDPDTVAVLTPGVEAVWYVSAHSMIPETTIECEERFTFTAAQAPTLVITMTPAVTPIVIPPQGGSFEFELNITNNGTVVETFDGWIDVILPNSTLYPLLMRENMNLSPGASIIRNMTQYVPAGAPIGDYEYWGHIGDYPNTIVNEDSFSFEKSGLDLANSQYNSWILLGWDSDYDNFIIIPNNFVLEQNFPNPFNPETSIRFGVPQAAKVKIVVYDVIGREIITLADREFLPGYHVLKWNAENASSGIYFVRMESTGFTESVKMLLVR
ncbi:MAG: T9SS type A sorting domain-containing protein [FCB group bacterium]|nr:T9SS type A sorting domain-containing protein [FCB group bacterium]